MRQIVCVTCLLLGVVWIVSCTPQNAPPPSTAQVKGTVSLDGKPMQKGEVMLSVTAQPPKTLEIKNGTFEGEVFVGKNSIEVVLHKPGPPSSTDPNTPTTINAVGSCTPNSLDIPKGGASDLKIDAVSAK